MKYPFTRQQAMVIAAHFQYLTGMSLYGASSTQLPIRYITIVPFKKNDRHNFLTRFYQTKDAAPLLENYDGAGGYEVLLIAEHNSQLSYSDIRGFIKKTDIQYDFPQ